MRTSPGRRRAEGQILALFSSIAALYGGMVAFGAGLPGVGIGLVVLGVLLAGFAWDASKTRR